MSCLLFREQVERFINSYEFSQDLEPLMDFYLAIYDEFIGPSTESHMTFVVKKDLAKAIISKPKHYSTICLNLRTGKIYQEDFNKSH